MAIKQSYKTELENINEIIAVIEYYKSDLESVLGKMQQDVDSPLFVSILRIVLPTYVFNMTHPRLSRDTPTPLDGQTSIKP